MRLVSKHDTVGYLPPAARPGCRNCRHYEVTRHDSPVIAPRGACIKHDLEVTAGGICDTFAAKPRGVITSGVQLNQMDLLACLATEARHQAAAGSPTQGMHA